MVNVIARRPRGRRADRVPRLGPRATALFAAFTAGAVAEYFFFDRRHARRRRHMARERGVAVVRRRSRAAIRRARYAEGVAEGVAHRATHAVPARNSKAVLDDISLAQKVESVAFREAGVSKAHVSVNAEKGVVFLRGRVETEDEIKRLVRAAAAVDGVERVENLLHTSRFQAAR
jgi:hypothetical protein